MKFNIPKLYIVVGVCVLMSCTDLEPKLYSELVPTTKFTNPDDAALGILLQNYSNLDGYAGSVWQMQELTSETSAAPAKFGPWDDGGVWARLHRHEWQTTYGTFDGAWGVGFSGIASCNLNIEQLKVLGQEEGVAELRALRAVYYWLMIDLFGDVPLEVSFATGVQNPSRQPRAQVYKFIVDELNELIDSGLLSDVTSGPYYGRMNQWSALALLTKVYLNAGVYTGTPQWALAAETAKKIIDGGKFILEPDYFTNFAILNAGSKENIFVIPYEKSNAGGFQMHMQTLHPLNRLTYNFTDGPWNGFTALEEFYNSYDVTDKRKDQFIVGQQYDASGAPLLDPNGATEVDSDGDKDPDGQPLIFTPFINELTPKAFSQSGARLGKFTFESGIGTSAQNDFPIFRFADILLMRAEALWRLNSASAESVELIRQVRERAGLSILSPLTENGLYEEILRELAYEAHARPTMIRFGTFDDARWEKPASAPTRSIFPIPTNRLNANPNLGQNPGY